MSEDYERQTNLIQTVLETLNREQAELDNGVDIENAFLVTFRKYLNITTLTRELLVELIDHIKVYENGNISVKFNFADEYRRVVEYIEANTHKAVG